MKRRPPFRWVGDRQRNPFVVRRVPRPAPAANIDDLPASCVKVNRSWVPHLLGALESLTQDDAWSQAGYHAQQQIEALMAALVDGTCPDCPPGTTKEVYIQFVEEDCDCEDEHDMKPIYQKFGGTWYIGFPCDSCGGYEWVPLGAGVALDPSGAPLGINDIPQGGAGAGNLPTLTPEALSCFSVKVTPYLTGLIIDYTRLFTNLTAQAASIAEIVDEVFNISALTANFEQINDDILFIAQFSEEDIEDAFNSTTLQAVAGSATADLFSGTSNISRALLASWASRLPVSVSAVYTRIIAQSWARTANVTAIADRIQRFAIECGTGLQLVESPTLTGERSLTFNDEVYLIKTVQYTSFEIVGGTSNQSQNQSRFYPVFESDDLRAVYVSCTAPTDLPGNFFGIEENGQANISSISNGETLVRGDNQDALVSAAIAVKPEWFGTVTGSGSSWNFGGASRLGEIGLRASLQGTFNPIPAQINRITWVEKQP